MRALRLTLIALILLAGCSGWHLRGTQRGAVSIKSVYLNDTSARYLGEALTAELRYAGVAVTAQKNNAQAVIDLIGESFDRRVLSVDPDTGKVRELELGLEVKFSVRKQDGKLLIAPENLSWVQDFLFDENSLLGTVERAQIIERDLAEDAAKAIILRLETVELK